MLNIEFNIVATEPACPVASKKSPNSIVNDEFGPIVVIYNFNNILKIKIFSKNKKKIFWSTARKHV